MTLNNAFDPEEGTNEGTNNSELQMVITTLLLSNVGISTQVFPFMLVS